MAVSEEKRTDRWGFIGEIEAAYGTEETLASTDGILVAEEPLIDVSHANDGKRRLARSPLGRTMKRVKKSGRFGTLPLVMEPVGPEVAYSATNFFNWHKILRSCGMLGTLDATPGSEKWTYTPRYTGLEGMSFASYTRAERAALHGAMGVFELSAETGEVPVLEAEYLGIVGAVPDDSATDITTFTYHLDGNEPPKFEGANLIVGSYLLGRIRSFSLKQNATVSPRTDAQNADAHGGYVFRHGEATLEMVLEATPDVVSPFHTTAGLNPRQLTELTTAIAVSITGIGGVDYGRFEINALQAQLEDFEEDDADGVALWNLTWSLPVATAVGATDWNITCVK